MTPGKIRKIKLKDFITHSELELEAGPNFNLIIGPNGSGKSSIISAIILGLGGTPKVIGRGTKISEYVRNSCQESKIDIELQGESNNKIHTITRVFNIDNKSIWYINNKNCTEQAVLQLVEKLNIQVNNLCQFLPQDRVQDFAKMNKKELLINTQKATGKVNLMQQQESLIEMKNNLEKNNLDIKQLTSKMDHAKSTVMRLENKVKNLNEKKKIHSDMKNINRKIRMLQYKEKVEEKNDIEKDKNYQQEEIKEISAQIEPTEKKIKDYLSQMNSIKNLNQKLLQEISLQESKIATLLEEANLENIKKEIKINLDSQLKEIEAFQAEVNVMKSKISKLQNDENSLVNKYGTEQQIDETVSKLSNESTIIQHEIEKLNEKRVNVINICRNSRNQIKHLEDKLNEMENIKQKRLEILARRDRDAYKAVLWLREHKHLFEEEIYEPMICELSVLDPSHAKYFESIIPMRDRVAFTFVNREDMNLFLKKVREEEKLKVNAIHSGVEHPPSSSYRPLIPIEQLRPYGFFAYATSLISGPEPILKYLCRMSSLHTIPIGDRTTYNKVNQVPDQIRLFFSDTHRFSVNVSRYTQEKSTRISEVHSLGLFNVCIDQNLMNQTQLKLKEYVNNRLKLEEKLRDIENEKESLDQKRRQVLLDQQHILQQKNQINIIKERIITASNSLERHLKNKKSEDEVRKVASNQLKVAIKMTLKKHKEITVLSNSIYEILEKQKLLDFEYDRLRKRKAFKSNKIQELKTRFDELKITLKNIDLAYTRVNEELNESREAVRRLCDGVCPTDSRFSSFADSLKKFPSDLNELDNLRKHLQTRMECILTADTDEIDMYEKGKDMLSECERQIKEKNENIKELETKIQDVYHSWIQELEVLISNINSKFSDYFEAMQCAGEVAISHDSGPENYADYGICTRVTFRANEPLQELNRYTQSGGERAVATAIYMLSLQHLTIAPFRCIDEINQGMDQINEKRIFDILLKPTKLNNCQYFLVTPKLIPDLSFNNDIIKIHIVINSTFCELKFGKKYL